MLKHAPRLTQRQRDVAAYIAEGYTNLEIATRLEVGRETVRSHVAALHRAHGTRRRCQLIAVLNTRTAPDTQPEPAITSDLPVD